MNADTLRRHKLNNWLHTALLLGGMALVLAAVGWLLGGTAAMIWVLAVVVVLLASAPRVSPRLLLSMYGARRLEPVEIPDLNRLTHELARRAGLQYAPELYYVPSPMMNAFTVGRRGDAAIAITDGLLRRMSWRELAGVLAHEMSHVAHNDIRVMGLADLVARLTRLLSVFGQVLVLVNLPLILFTDAGISWVAILLLVFAPTISAVLQLALSRTREFNADMGAAELTGDPRGLASALAKLERQQHGLLEYLFMPGRSTPEPSMLRTHPQTEARIERLLSLAPPEKARVVRIPVTVDENRNVPERFPPVNRRLRRHLFGGFWH